jgi:hypothetical protein
MCEFLFGLGLNGQEVTVEGRHVISSLFHDPQILFGINADWNCVVHLFFVHYSP